MDISELDPNFQKNADESIGVRVDLPSPNIALYGVHYEEGIGFLRLEDRLLEHASYDVRYLNRHTVGGRACFSTESRSISLCVSYPNFDRGNMSLPGFAGFVLSLVSEGKESHLHTFSPKWTDEKGYSESFRLMDSIPPGKHDFILYFPLYNKVGSLSLCFEEGASVEPSHPYRDLPPIVYYGSSITQGGCASRPDNCYEALVAKKNRIDYRSLGFSGNAKGETLLAEAIASLACSAFVLDYDFNAPDAEHLAKTHEPFFLAFRAKHPKTPVILMSAPDYDGSFREGGAREAVIRATYENALRRGDGNVYFLSGGDFFPEDIRESCSVDGTHPNDLGFYFISEKLLSLLNKIL